MTADLSAEQAVERLRTELATPVEHGALGSCLSVERIAHILDRVRPSDAQPEVDREALARALHRVEAEWRRPSETWADLSVGARTVYLSQADAVLDLLASPSPQPERSET